MDTFVMWFQNIKAGDIYSILLSVAVSSLAGLLSAVIIGIYRRDPHQRI